MNLLNCAISWECSFINTLLFEIVQAASANWDGSEPIRRLD